MTSASNVNTSGEIPYLTTKDSFHQWRFEFEGLAYRKNFRDIMEERELEPEDIPKPDDEIAPGVAFQYDNYNRERKEKFKNRMREGFGYLLQAVSRYPTLVEKMRKDHAEANLVEAWKTVIAHMVSHDVGSQMTVETQLSQLKQGDLSMMEYSAELDRKFLSLHPQPDDNRKKYYFSRGLNTKYKGICDAMIISSASYTELVVNMCRHYERIMSEEAAAAASRTDSNDAEKHRAEEKANYARAGNGNKKNFRDKKNTKWNSKANNNRNSNQRDNRNGKKNDKRKRKTSDTDAASDDAKDTDGKEIVCFNCHGKGHMARECPSPKTSSDDRRVKSRK